MLCFYGETFSQLSVNSQSTQITDWAVLFPEIPNCEQVIQALTRNNNVFEQTVIYEWKGYPKNKNENYVSCGTITLRSAHSARKEALQNFRLYDSPTNQRVKIRGFDAFRDGPMCGNDVWIGSTSVYFDDDKLLIVSAYGSAGAILEFAQNADYELIKNSMNKIIKKSK